MVHAVGQELIQPPSQHRSTPSQDRSTVEPFYENIPRNQEAEGLVEDTYFLNVSSKCEEDVYVAAAPESENVYANSVRPEMVDDEADLLDLRSADAQPDVQCSSGSDLVPSEHNSGPSAESFLAVPPAERQSSTVSNEPPRLPASLRSSLLDVKPTGSNGENHEVKPVGLPSYDEAVSSPNSLNEDLLQYCRLRPHSVALPPVSYSRVIPRSSALEPLSSNAAAVANSRVDGHGLTLPPPYSARKTLSVGANVPLKEAQLQKLVQEMNDTRGIPVVIPMAQCQSTIAFVECFNQIW